MRVVKNTAAFLMAVLIAVSSFVTGYAESGTDEGTEEKEQTKIRINEQYSDCTDLVVFSDFNIFDFETVNFYQRNESNEKTLISTVSVAEHCSKRFDAPDNVFSLRLVGKNPFESQGQYTFEFIAKETPPEGGEKENDISVDFTYEDIINPEIKNEIIDYTMEVGQKADISEIIDLPEDYLCVYTLGENKPETFFDEQIIQIENTSIKGVSRGETVLIIKEVFSGDTIVQVNIRVIPETPDNFLELIGSTLGIVGFDTLKSLISTGSYGALGLGGLFYSLLFPIVALLSFFGAIIGF